MSAISLPIRDAFETWRKWVVARIQTITLRYCNGLTRMRGFTLIELLVAMLVIGILAAIAQATYTVQVRKGNRAAAEAFLMDVATREQQYFLDVRVYTDIPTLGMTASQQVNTAYSLTAVPSVGNPPGFSVTAAPKGAQLSDSCGTLGITDTGIKTPANCW